VKSITAVFYKNPTGKEPVRDFLKEFKKEDKLAIGTDIKTVEYGFPIGMPVCKSIGNGLFEVRSNISDKRIVRVLFVIQGSLMILLHGFIKKTQKTPDKELAIAKQRLKDLEMRVK
jgi:phage-related protein